MRCPFSVSIRRLITTGIANRTFDSPAFSLGKGSARRQSPLRAFHKITVMPIAYAIILPVILLRLTKDDFSSYEPESHKDSGH
tara:strand:- start:402 stop:650 length:249 start_codon:yes stop_codon:yes gene_type:complete